MKLLKHPVRAIREPFGTAGLIVAIAALVLATTGAAFAAGALTGKQKKEVEKIAKKFAGKPGAAGAAGPVGPAGPKGDTGAKGDKGDTGSQGNPGTPGAAGKGVVLTAEAKGANCAEGGTKVEVEGNAASKKYVCNGVNGTSGFTETLPPGKTETGAWSISVPAQTSFFEATESISFPIPMPAPGKAIFFSGQEVEEEEFGSTGCHWEIFNPASLPEAPPGTLCVFAQPPTEIASDPAITAPGEPLEVTNFGVSGANLVFTKVETAQPEQIRANGAWAVTAPTP